MIKYKLSCEDCNLSFDSWFASSKEYEKLKKLKHINRHDCNSLNIKKSLMSPSILKSDDKKHLSIKKEIRKYQRFIKSNFKYVGKNFLYEARSIHYDKKKNSNGIYGKASIEEIKELQEEGIETTVVPWFSENDN